LTWVGVMSICCCHQMPHPSLAHAASRLSCQGALAKGRMKPASRAGRSGNGFDHVRDRPVLPCAHSFAFCCSNSGATNSIPH